MTGQLVRRGDRKWLVRVPMGRDAAGKRRYHNTTVNGTKKEAERYLHNALTKRDLGQLAEPSRMTLDQYLDRWLEEAARPRVRARTFDDYSYLLASHVRPKIGAYRLDSIRPLDVQAVYNAMTARGLTGRTVHVTHNVLRQALKQAVRWRMLPINPAADVDLPRWEKRKMRALSPEEATRFLAAAAGDPQEVFFQMALATGMCPGELFGLCWDAVDLREGAVRVVRALVQIGSAWSLEEPKTEGSRRTIPLPRSLVRSLATYKARQAEHRLALGEAYEDNGLVFASELGTPLSGRNLAERHLRPILARAGIAGAFRIYDLRHTCATLLLAAGEHPKVVAERLGHSTVTLTLDTYSHLIPGMQERATERLETLLFR